MGTINKKKIVETDKGSHANFMGGPSWNLKNPLATLRMAAASSFFGEPQYYIKDAEGKLSKPSRTKPAFSGGDYSALNEQLGAIMPVEWRGMSTNEIMESAIDKALDHDAEGTLALADELRNVWNIRTTPQVILVRAAHHPKVRGTGLVRRYATCIVKRADEPAVGLAYQLATYGRKAIPNALKKAWRDYLLKTNEYSFAKYRMENREVKTVDVMNLVHPTRTDAINKLATGKLKTTDQTWESIISVEGSNAKAWTKAIDVMGHMALLRNVRNLLEKGLAPELFIQKLIEGAPNGKQLPFRYFSAYKAVQGLGKPQVLDAIEECLKISLGNLPKFSGRVMSLADNSGSAWGSTTSSLGTMHMAEIANLTGILTGMVADEGHLALFGDHLKEFPLRKSSSVFDQFDKANEVGKTVGQATEHGIWLFWDKAIRNKEHWDHVFVYSDMQAGHGGLYGTTTVSREFIHKHGGSYIDVPKLVKEYRKKVNPNVNVYLVQVAGYTDTIMPEFYDRTYILGGWSDSLLRFADQMAKIADAQRK